MNEELKQARKAFEIDEEKLRKAFEKDKEKRRVLTQRKINTNQQSNIGVFNLKLVSQKSFLVFLVIYFHEASLRPTIFWLVYNCLRSKK